jgi:uncharacterized membrane protein YbhN (UPF0104 family)
VAEPPSPRRGAGWTKTISLALAACFTAALFWYLTRATSWADWTGMWAGVDHRYLMVYMGLFASVMLLKAVRYRMLLKASEGQGAPGLGDLTLLTFVGNLFVDLLPARSGSLAYIVFLNQKLDVRLAACFSSFAFAFVFDIIGMLPLLLAAILSYQAGAGNGSPWLWVALGVLAAAGLSALALMDRVLGLAGRLLAVWTARLADPDSRWVRGLARLGEELEHIAQDMAQVKAQGVFWPLLGVSAAIRVGKYLSLYLLILGLAVQWGPEATGRLTLGLVLFSLVLAEATASLPISGLAGFGAYEGVMIFVLRQAGMDPTQAALLPVTLHLLTQTLDYSTGGVALLRLLSKTRAAKNAENGP